MVALLIVRTSPSSLANKLIVGQGAIGVLDRTEMDRFADIFMLYQKRGKAEDPQGAMRR